MRRVRLVSVVLAVSLAFVGAACGDSSSSSTTTTAAAAATTTTAPSLTGTIIVSAAASLTESFGTIKDQFVAANPDASVAINFGSSGALETQIESGAPADVVAFADTANMQKLADKDLLAAPAQSFVTNKLIIVTKPGNPTNITSLADLATAGVISLCVDTAPCGKYANQILQTAGVTIPESSITRGADVKTTLAAVTEGDAVAGIVYVTDAQAAGSSVDGVEIPDARNAIATYPIAVIKATTNSELAQGFVDYVLGADGQAVLQAAGFGTA